MKNGMELILEERKRQISEEVYTHTHDDIVNDRGQLAKAADCYARPPVLRSVAFMHRWPWEKDRWRPRCENRVGELVKAGALYLAEAARLSRVNRGYASNVMEGKARGVARKINRLLPLEGAK